MPNVPLARWAPDRFADVEGLNVASEASGVWPGPDGYIPWPQTIPFSVALPTACLGSYAARTTAGSYKIFAGTATKLYLYVDAVTAWTDVTRLVGGDYSVPVDDTWSFAQFGSRLICCNANDDVQYIDVDVLVAFAALGGSPPKARIVRVVGDFVMLAGLTDNPNRIRWSGRNNSDFWSPGTQDSDFQDFPDGGFVNGVAPLGQNRGLIFQQTAIRAYGTTTDRTIFNFQLIEANRGLLATDSLVTSGGISYYLSQTGYFATDGSGQSKPIGADVIDKWFQDTINFDRISTVRGAVDPIRQRIIWLAPIDGSTSQIHDVALAYDITRDQFSHASVSGSYILAAATAGYTVETIGALLTSLGYTLETAPFSFDAKFLLGGTPYLAVFGSTFKMEFFTGNPQAAIVETGNFIPVAGRRSMIRAVRPLSDAANCTVTIGSKERPSGTITFGTASVQNSQGVCPTRASGLFHRVRLSIAANETWSYVSGIEPDVVAEGIR